MNSVKTYAVLNFIIKSKSNRNMIPQTNREVLWTQQAMQRGVRWVLEHLPLSPLMAKVPFCQGNFFILYVIKCPFMKACPI